MTNSGSSATSSVANRYGTPKRALTKRSKLWIVVAASVVALAWILWTVLGGGSKAEQKVLSYHVVDSTLATVELTMTKDPEKTAHCAVQALNSTYAVVGWKVITIGPNSKDVGVANGRTTTVNAQVRTDSLAVTGVVDNCWIVD